MQKLNYKEVKKFQANVEKKLFSYINSNEEILSILDELELNHPYFLEDENKIAFNMWLTSDYLLNEDTTIIDKFIESKNSKISPEEKKYLLERKMSHLSVFEIIRYRGDYIYIRDLLLKKDYQLWEPDLIDAIDEGEIILARICKILDNHNFIGDINHLPSMTKADFQSNLMLDFNNIRKVYPQLTMKSYLKKYPLNIYRIYSESIFKLIDMREDMDLYLFNELNDFSAYMERKNREPKLKEYTSNLINIYEYFFLDKSMFLSDIDKVNLYDFINNGIDDGFIDSKTSLNSYLASLIKYIQFLEKKDSKYRKAYEDILKISENRFYFMERLSLNDIFQINKNLLPHVQINTKLSSLLDDFEHFIFYIGEKHPLLTEKNKHLKREDLLALNDAFDNKYKILSKNPNQKSFPLIDFFYYSALDLGLVYFQEDYMDLDPNAISFIKLVDEEKYILLFQYLWSLDYFYKVLDADSLRKDLAKALMALDPRKEYNVDSLNQGLSNFLKENSYYLRIFNLISYKKDVSTFKLTPMGHKILNALEESLNSYQASRVIDLDSFRNNK